MVDVGIDNYDGIDVSRWQGDIDFKKVKESGIKIVYIKCTDGTSKIDPKFKQNYTNAKANGLKVGAYHYYRVNSKSDASLQAQNMAKTIEGLDIDCLLALDIEQDNGLSKTELTNQCLEFLTELERLTGLNTCVYTYNYFATEFLDTRLSVYPVWIADYYGEYILNNPIWDTWVGYQYSETGTVPGIEGYVDLNYFKERIFQSSNNQKEQIGYAYYTLQSGDNLYTLAKVFKTTEAALAALNDITPDTILYPGQKIKVNADLFLTKIPNNQREIKEQIYIVKPGDTLYTIARKFNIDVDVIIKKNNLPSKTYIYSGQKLII